MRHLSRLLAACAAVVVILVATAGPASAHAQLESTSPPQSAVLETAPNQVVLHFGEPVEIDFGSLRVIGPDGRRVDNGGTRHPAGDSHAVSTALPADLGRGTYVVAWRVVSADSHPVHGAFVFSVGSAAGTTKAESLASALNSQTGSGTVGSLYWLIRLAAFTALTVLVGLAAMVTLVWRSGGATRRVGRLLWVCWSVLLATSLLGIAIQGVYAAALPLTDVVHPALINAVLHTRFGKIELVRLAMLAAFIPVLLGIQGRLGNRATRWLWVVPSEIVVGIALLFTPGLAGHASTGSQTGLGMTLDVLHLAAASVWLGGLALLATVLIRSDASGDRPEDPLLMTIRVSSFAFWAVVVVVVTGVFQSIRQVGSFYALFHTVYGQTLLVKVGLVTALILIGAVSRRIVRGRSWLLPTTGVKAVSSAEPANRGPTDHETGTDRSASSGLSAIGTMSRTANTVGRRQAVSDTVRRTEISRLRRSVLAEIVIAVIVLAVTAMLVNAVPANQAASQPFSYSFQTLGVQVNTIVDPARAGPENQFHVYVLSRLGTPMLIPELDASISLPAQNLGPLTVPLVLGGVGHYIATHVDIPAAGTWILRLTVRTDAIDEQVVSTPFSVR
jgi:copper transport protein